ncbi:DUF3077 domain-containing protein [Pseudomonas sp.]|uniref:DUF3077 domain-containing protein n=1 Tax=Pseudomonas sp. TaxID=306 RepID=UPI0028A973CA|nr:DUF3077 domain-containing protein [Pseudomonas sp.]
MSEQTSQQSDKASVSVGSATFGEGASGTSTHRLFRVIPGHDHDYLLEQASILMSCVYQLNREASLERDDKLIVAAYYLSGMAKALIEDIAMARTITPPAAT